MAKTDAISLTVAILGSAVLAQTVVAMIICSDQAEKTPVYTNRGTLALSAVVPAIVCTVTYVNVYDRRFSRGRMWFYVCMTLVHWHMWEMQQPSLNRGDGVGGASRRVVVLPMGAPLVSS